MDSASTRERGGSRLLRYATAAGLVAAAVVVRLAIELVLTIDLPFLVFFPAIIAAALWSGRGPALFATILSAGAAAAHVWLPVGTDRGMVDVEELLIFVTAGALIAWLVESSRMHRRQGKAVDDARREATEQRERQGAAEKQVAELAELITARTKELEEREALMQAVVETAVDAILTIDERGMVRSFNRAAERMFGYAAAEVVGRNVNQLMPSPFREQHDTYVERYLTTGAKRIIGIGREITARRKDGSTFPMYLSVSEVGLAGQRLFTGFIRDLTEQKRLEQEFLRAQKMEAIGRFSGAIAHDFNNILMGILACSRVTGSDLPKQGPLRASLDEIGEAANRGVALTRRLLAFSRGRQTVELRPTDLDGVLRENEAMLRQLLGEDVVLRIELSAPGGSLLGDPGLIEQIVINLLVNARDAMPGGGEISVSTRIDAHEMVLDVKDTGSGIPPELHTRVFEPFFTTKAPDKGTGLGLSTVKRITDQLSGRIELQSAIGQGTTFRLVFPRCEPAPIAAPVPQPSPPGRNERGTVLLVEDDRLVRASLLRFLKGKGYTVLAASTPAEAQAIARQNGSFDVLVTDMVLPELMGNELADRLHASVPNMQVIYMSAHPAELLVARGQLREGAPYLEKPFEMEALDRLLAQLLARGDGGREPSTRPAATSGPGAGSLSRT